MKYGVMALVLAAAAGTANAGITGNALTITASEGTASAMWTLNADRITWGADGVGTWTAAPGWGYNFMSGDTLLGRLESTAEKPFSVTFVEDPVISINFTAISGGGPTLFTFSSGLLGFATINPAQATASAGVTLTDRDGNGATLTGAYGDGSAHKANYNGLVPGGTNFASFNLNSVAGIFGTQTTTGNTGPLAPIGAANSMSSEFSFTVSALDSVSGTSVFAIIPTPGSLGIVGVAGLLASRRRRA